MSFDLERLSHYPEGPGVYLMKDLSGSILYIGKAKNLKLRLKQYFLPGRDDRVQVPFLVASLHDIETILVQTEKEALLLEARLIRKWKPKYNVLLKDDRSRLMIRIGLEHVWPKIEYIRSKDTANKPEISLGPFSHTKEMFRFVTRLFQIRQCSDEEFKRRLTPCILYQIKACSAPCVGKISNQEYKISIDNAIDFLSGNVSWVKEKLYQEMLDSSDKLEFEKAQRIHEQIGILESFASTRETDRIDGIGNVDVIGMWYEGVKGLSLAIMHYRKGILQYSEGWIFTLSELYGDEVEIESILISLLIQLYQLRASSSHSKIEVEYDEILIPHLLQESISPFQEALSDLMRKKISVKSPLIGPKAKILALATENAKARLLQKKEVHDVLVEVLTEMVQEFHLTTFPHLIDCFDASHFGGRGRVAASVSFLEGLPHKKRYRTFKVDELSAPNDLLMLEEAIVRRYKKNDSEEEQIVPNLIIIDGGKTQFNAAKEALQKLGLYGVIDLIAVTKEGGRHDKGMTQEKVYTMKSLEPILLSQRSPLLHFIQRVRDEAHRFTLQFQKKQRMKHIRKSFLDDIPGIGPKKKAKILRVFSDAESLLKSTQKEISSQSGISLRDAQIVHTFFSDKMEDNGSLI